jgi:AcrR family transcriptional regulator
VTGTDAAPTRRERKKQETHTALRRAALDLFATKGFRETRVSDIAEAADVAPATFFRHFASKEEVALVDLVARIDRVIAGLEARPDDEGPLAACRALVDTPAGTELTPGPDEILVAGLVARNPSLSGHFFWQMQNVTGRLALEFGRRMGEPHTSLRPQLLASAVVGALNAVLMTWLSDPAGASPTALSAEAFAALAEGMDWPRATS